MISGLEISQQEVVEVPNCMIVKFSGSFVSYNRKFYTQRINKVIDDGFVNLIFDLDRLSYVDSTWDFGSLALKRVKPLGGNIVYVNMQQRIKEVFDLIGFTHFFHFATSYEQAVSFFKVTDKTEANQYR